jgi:hypothetical protein
VNNITTPQEQARIMRLITHGFAMGEEAGKKYLLKVFTDNIKRAMYRERELTQICHVCGAKRQPGQGGPR